MISYDQPLSHLADEAESLQATLQSKESESRIFPVVYARVSLERIAEMINESQWRIRIFHFAGDAHGEKLELTDLGIAFGFLGRMLAQKMQTELVFLNGCGTQELVAPLQAAGIPAIIATQAPVNDRRASAFAKH